MGAVRDHSILIACIGAGSAIVAAFAKPICETLFPEPPGKPIAAVVMPLDADEPITPTPGEAPPIEGAWKQYVLTTDQGAVYLGTFVVTKYQGDYVVAPRAQAEGEQYINTLGIFDVNYDGRKWTFNSNWGEGEGVGNFELQRVSPSMFEGEIRVAGQLSNRTRFVKIE